MTPAARIAAAIEVLADIEQNRRPTADAIRDWGKAHRFAGSGDRANVANLVYDTLRRKASAQWLMGAETPRAAVIGMLRLMRGLDTAGIAALFGVDRYAAPALSAEELARLDTATLSGAPAHVAADYPEWLDPYFARAFGEARGVEISALAARAPLDLRVNALKAIRPQIMEAIGHLQPEPTPLSPDGLRLLPREDGRVPYVQAEPAFIKGAVEVQDEGSQLVARLANAQPGEQVLDLCAGGGGKTLALAAAMNNKGQIFATDNDARRLRNIHERLERAGVRNVQVKTPTARAPKIDGLSGKMDLVLVDAPCTGTGTWRRNPDAKWRMRPGSLDQRMKEQAEVLDLAAACVKPGGRLVYITCSVLDEENGAQIKAFLARHKGFRVVPPAEFAGAAGLAALAKRTDISGQGLLLSPARSGTDGFFAACLVRN
ncbi:MAG: RsmB/NOP family class I SAM-dependent RNA methyltransferase [Proteobacteria bacterium]|nr:RsmB/NOP family class I SAM-dependent RNA methyltransferase [Pseudomonadota bacterium]